MNIKITNTTTAITDAESIISCANSFDSLVSTMLTTKNNFVENWIGEENADRTSIIESLNNSINFYQNKIIPALKKLGNGVYAYAVATEQLAAASVLNPMISAGMTPSEYVEANCSQGDSTIYDQNAYDIGAENQSSLFYALGDNQERWDTLDEMYLFFRNKGLTDEQIAGVLGNAVLESGLNLDVKNSSSSARGLFQWLDTTIYTTNGTKEGNQPSDWSLQTQLEHTWHQMQVKPDINGVTVINHLDDNKQDVSDAARTFAIFFEGCTDGYGGRINYANAIYAYIKDNFY